MAALAGLAPLATTPLAYNASVIAITACTMATFSVPQFRHLVERDGLRVAVCAGTVCIPAYPGLLATVTDVGWFLAIWLVFLSVMRMPRSPAGVAGWCLGGALAVWSTPLAPVAAPLWVLRAIRGVRRRCGPDMLFAATQLASLVAVLAITGTRSAGVLQTLPDGSSTLDWQPGDLWSALAALGWVLACCVDAAMMPLLAFNRLERHGTLAVAAPALIAAIGLAFALRDVSTRGRVTVGLAIYLYVASLLLVLAGRPGLVRILRGEIVPELDFPSLAIVGVRHRALANVALLLVVAGLLDGARRARTRIAALAAAAVVVAAWAPELRLPPSPDVRWPIWAARLEHKLASGSREPLVIPAYPPSFKIVLDGTPARDSR